MDFNFSNIINTITEFFSNIFGTITEFINNILKFLDNSYTKFAAIAAIIAIGSFICGSIIKRIKAINKHKALRKKEISKLGDITDELTLKLIKSKNFIPTMGQYEPPHDADSILISPKRFSLLEKFINEFELEKESLDKKRYILLGGSGMGKSTFSVALFYKYINSINFKKCHAPIYIKSLANPDILNELQSINISNKGESIIILDALDENINAAKDMNGFMKDLEQAINNFKFVIITCRTQFFQDEDNEPQKWSIPKSGASRRVSEYEKIYISPFTDKETNDYLKKKYKQNQKKFNNALQVLEKFNDVLSRPLILSFIDDILELDNIENRRTVELYSAIIDKWFDREIEVQTIDKSELYSFSKKIAFFIYENWQKTGNAFVSNNEYQNFLEINEYKQSPYSFKERSLINRRKDGSIKFSHRSFWEFFLAINIFEHPGYTFRERGISMTKQFAVELYDLYLNSKFFNYINYPDSGLSFAKRYQVSDNYFKKILDDLFEKKTQLDKTNQDELDDNKRGGFSKDLYNLWEMMLPFLVWKQHVFMQMLSVVNVNKFISLRKRMNDYLTKTDELCGLMHSFFLNNDYKLFDNIRLKLIELFYAQKLIKERGFKMSFKGKPEELLFFADLYRIAMDTDDSDKEHPYYQGKSILVLGHGFISSLGNQESLVHNGYSNYQIIFVYYESNDLNDIVSFITQNHQLNSILIITYKTINIYYLINTKTIDYCKNEIKLILENMYKAKANIIN